MLQTVQAAQLPSSGRGHRIKARHKAKAQQQGERRNDERADQGLLAAALNELPES
jgi:hypothetical protein